MADKRITTELVVKAVDQYSGMIRNMSGVTGRFASKVRSEMGRLQGLRGPLRLIEDFRRQQKVVRASGEAMQRARERVRQLQAAIKSTRNPTAQMRREFDRARASAGRLEEKHRQNRRALSGLQGQMRSAGVDTRDLAGEQRRLTKALGASNTAFARQTERMQRMKVMQDRMAASRVRMDRSLATAANLRFSGGAAMGVGRRILSGISEVTERSGDQQSAFTEFQNLTGVGDGRIAQLRDELSSLRDVTKQSVDEMLAGLSILVGKGMDLEDALGALPATARAAFATSTSSDEMGAAGFALYDNLGIAPEKLKRAYDIMAMAGKEGGFELTAMAKSFPEITAGARALGMEGLGAVAQLTAALQISMKSAGSESQAANNLSNFLGKLTSPATVRKFAEMGISIEEELQKAMERGVSPMEHMLGVIEGQTGGDALKLGELFEDKQVLDFLRVMIPNMKEYARIRDEALGADGVVDADLARKMRDFNIQKGQLGEALGQLFTLPPEALEGLTAMLQRADAFVEKLIVWKKEHPGFTKAVFLGAAALGAMAVASGALLTVGAGVIGTMAVMRFGLVGLGARAAFAAGGLGGVGGAFRRLWALPKFALSGLLYPFKWTSRLIGKVPWIRLAGKLALSSLIVPLRWTASLLPFFGPALARFSGFRTSAASEITGLSKHVGMQSAAMSRSLSRIRWSAFSAGAMAFMALRQVPDNAEDLTAFQEGNSRSMDRGFRATPGISQLMTAYERSFKWVHGSAPPVSSALLPTDPEVRNAAKTVQGYAGEDNLPTDDRLQGMRSLALEIRAEIAALQAEMDAIGTPSDAYDSVSSEYQQAKSKMAARVVDLEAVEQQLSEDEAAAATLTSALQVLSDTSVTPEISTESIDRALAKVQELAAKLRSMALATSGATSGGTGAPVDVQERASGGPFGLRPLLVGERGPELYFPNRAGFIANNQQTQRLQQGAQRIRTAGLAGLAASALAVSGGAVAASSSSGGAQPASPSGKPSIARVEIGSIHIVAPSGVSDPEGLVDLLEARLGDRISATFAASFSD